MHILKAARYLLLAGLYGGAAQGDPILSFFTPASFFSSVPVASTESFDEFPTDTDIGVGSVTVDGITYVSSDPSAIWYVSDTFVTPSPPNGLVTRNVIAPETLTFAGGGSTDAIGFFLVGIGGFPPAFFRIDVMATDGQVLTEQIAPGLNTVSLFRGFAYQNGMSSVTITSLDLAGGLSNFHMDNVSRGAISAVPELSSLTLTAIGVAGLACWSRRGLNSPRRKRSRIERDAADQDADCNAPIRRGCDGSIVRVTNGCGASTA